MYDIERRKEFTTVGELKQLLAEVSNDTKVCITGDDQCWFHIEKDGSVVNLDCEDLDDTYEQVEH